MTNPLLGQQSGSSSSLLRLGDIVLDGTALALSVDGLPQSARWLQGYVPTLGDNVAFVVTRDQEGQSSNLVLGKVAATSSSEKILPDEALVTSVPASSATITVAIDGASYTAKFVGSPPAVGDRVLLEHRRSMVYVVGKVGTTPAPVPVVPEPPPAPPAPPPSGPTSGRETFGATDSATARVGSGWNTPSGQTVVQGSYGGVSYAGAWFYGTAPSSLAGRALTGARVHLPARRRMGSYNDAVVIHLYAHTSASRPGGDVSRVVGPHDVTLPPGWGGGWVDIPASLAAQVVAGGGLGIAGDPYAGLDGRGDNPQSGAVQIDWTA